MVDVTDRASLPWHITALWLGLALPQGAMGQAATAGSGSATFNNRDMEEVLVTGRQLGYYEREAESALRQSVPILETPVAVFNINAALIEDQQAFRLDQILQNDSSVQKSNNFLGAYSSYKVRGFELSNTS